MSAAGVKLFPRLDGTQQYSTGLIVDERVGQDPGSLWQLQPAECVPGRFVLQGGVPRFCHCDNQWKAVRLQMAVGISNPQQRNSEGRRVSAELHPVADSHRIDLPSFSLEP